MIISTDSTSNLPKEFYLKNDIKTIPMQIILYEEVYDDLSENLPSCEFCKKMREAFGARGGGRNGIVQGSVSASEADIRKLLEP